MIFVTKFDGRKQPFERNKVISTCLRLHASEKQAEDIANKIESKAYNNISTKKIFQMILRYLADFRPVVRHQIGLKEAISLLRPKPDFEQFVDMLLKEYGYEVQGNQMVRGRCVEHEIDAIAKKGKDITYVEVKHHLQPHTYTGIGVFLESMATFEDLIAGYEKGYHKYNFNKVLVVCNTKISDQAKQYATCMHMEHIGWKFPPQKGLESMIEEKRLYPVTHMKTLDRNIQQILGDAGIVTLKQLARSTPSELSAKTKLSEKRLRDIVKIAKEMVAS